MRAYKQNRLDYKTLTIRLSEEDTKNLVKAKEKLRGSSLAHTIRLLIEDAGKGETV